MRPHSIVRGRAVLKPGMSEPAGRQVGTTLALALLALAIGGPSEAGAKLATAERAAAGCVYVADQHILAVTVKRTPARKGSGPKASAAAKRSAEGQAYVVRNGDLILVLGGPDASPTACKGGAPTVRNTDYILVRAGKAVRRPELAIDLRRGLLGPGYTDERDGTSEIEVFADLGKRSRVVVSGTSDPDKMILSPYGAGETVNVNATEAVPDADVFLPRGRTILFGAAGGDLLSATSAPRDGSGGTPTGAGLVGGGGADILSGTAETDFLQGDGGADLLAAGAGSDIVYGIGGGSDQIDCGPGRDTFVVVDRSDVLSRCERHVFRDPFAASRALPASRPSAASRRGRSPAALLDLAALDALRR